MYGNKLFLFLLILLFLSLFHCHDTFSGMERNFNWFRRMWRNRINGKLQYLWESRNCAIWFEWKKEYWHTFTLHVGPGITRLDVYYRIHCKTKISHYRAKNWPLTSRLQIVWGEGVRGSRSDSSEICSNFILVSIRTITIPSKKFHTFFTRTKNFHAHDCQNFKPEVT